MREAKFPNSVPGLWSLYWAVRMACRVDFEDLAQWKLLWIFAWAWLDIFCHITGLASPFNTFFSWCRSPLIRFPSFLVQSRFTQEEKTWSNFNKQGLVVCLRTITYGTSSCFGSPWLGLRRNVEVMEKPSGEIGCLQQRLIGLLDKNQPVHFLIIFNFAHELLCKRLVWSLE